MDQARSLPTSWQAYTQEEAIQLQMLEDYFEKQSPVVAVLGDRSDIKSATWRWIGRSLSCAGLNVQEETREDMERILRELALAKGHRVLGIMRGPRPGSTNLTSEVERAIRDRQRGSRDSERLQEEEERPPERWTHSAEEMEQIEQDMGTFIVAQLALQSGQLEICETYHMRKHDAALQMIRESTQQVISASHRQPEEAEGPARRETGMQEKPDSSE